MRKPLAGVTVESNAIPANRGIYVPAIIVAAVVDAAGVALLSGPLT